MVVIITGGSDGIGAELARQWARRDGAKLSLVLAARSRDKLEAVAAECEALGARTLVIPCDVEDPTACQALVHATLGAFGGIDVLVNNAGMSAHALFDEVKDLAWYQRLMQINLWGPAWITQAALPAIKANRGRIVAVSSLAGLLGIPGRTAYSATKFAMTGFFEALRTEVASHGVSVTIAYPGVVDTKIRHRGFNARGEASGHSSMDERGAMRVETCARLILDGTLARERDIVMTAKGKLGRWLKLLAPRLVDRLALQALKREQRPQ